MHLSHFPDKTPHLIIWAPITISQHPILPKPLLWQLLLQSPTSTQQAAGVLLMDKWGTQPTHWVLLQAGVLGEHPPVGQRRLKVPQR